MCVNDIGLRGRRTAVFPGLYCLRKELSGEDAQIVGGVSEGCVQSEAALIACRDLSAEDRALLDELLFRIESERVSRGKKYLLMNIPTSALDEAVKILPAMRSPTVMPLAAEGWCSLHSVVEASDLWDKVRQLKAIGAEGILVLTLDKIIP